jgi:hypothetical protein
VLPAYFSQVFPPAYRFSGMSIGFTLGVIGGNAFAPAVATALLDATGGWTAVAVYAATTAVISLMAGLCLRERTAAFPPVATSSEVADPVDAPVGARD